MSLETVTDDEPCVELGDAVIWPATITCAASQSDASGVTTIGPVPAVAARATAPMVSTRVLAFIFVTAPVVALLRWDAISMSGKAAVPLLRVVLDAHAPQSATRHDPILLDGPDRNSCESVARMQRFGCPSAAPYPDLIREEPIGIATLGCG